METIKTLSLTIDQDLVDQYNTYYFEQFPRRRKPPIERPIHESINRWMIMGNISRNNLKQNWKNFVVWWVQKLGLEFQIDECSMKFKTFYPTRRRADCDNVVPKFILDGFVESGLLIDDDYHHLQELSLSCSYDKNNPRTEITVFIYKEHNK